MDVVKLSRHRPNLRLISTLCAAVGIAVYLTTLDCGFCYDDKSVILENHDVIGESSWQLLWNDFWGHPIHLNTSHKSYRPLCVATFRLNYLLHELQPMGYHLVNVLLHGAVCYLYVQLCGVVFSQAVWPALIAGLLFAVHPIHTEAVAGLVGRADLLAAIFFILSFLSYHKAITDAPSSIGVFSNTDATSLPFAAGHGHLIQCLVFLLCAVVSKELGLTVVAVCLTYDLFLVNKVSLKDIWKFLTSHPQKGSSPFSRSLLSRAVPLILFSVVILIGRFWLMKSAPVFTKYDNEALVLDFPYRQLQWSYLIFFNSYLLFHPSLLLHDYRMGAVPLITSLLDHRILLTVVSLAFYAGLLVYAFSKRNLSLSRFFKRRQVLRHNTDHMTNDVIINGAAAALQGVIKRSYSEQLKSDLLNSQSLSGNKYTTKEVLLFGLSLVIFPFLPASNLFFPVGFVVAERVLYLPSMGFCMLVAYGAHRLIQSKANWLSIAAKLSIALLLATHSLKTLHRSRDWYSRGTLFKSLVKYYPTNGYILSNLALDLFRAGDEATSEKLNRYAMEVASEVPLSYVNLGSLLKHQGRLEEAEQVWRKAVVVLEREEEPKTDKIAQLYTSLCGMVSGHAHRLRAALELCDRAVSVRNDLPDVHNMRGAVLTKMGRHKEAQLAFERALRRNPQNVNTMFNLALAYQNLGDVTVAMEILQWVLAVDHTHQLAKDQLRNLANAH